MTERYTHNLSVEELSTIDLLIDSYADITDKHKKYCHIIKNNYLNLKVFDNQMLSDYQICKI